MVARTIRRVRRVFIRGIGVVAVLFGLFLALIGVRGGGTGSLVVLGVGAFVALIGIGMIMRPHRVRVGRPAHNSQRHDDDSHSQRNQGDPHMNRRGGR